MGIGIPNSQSSMPLPIVVFSELLRLTRHGVRRSSVRYPTQRAAQLLARLNSPPAARVCRAPFAAGSR